MKIAFINVPTGIGPSGWRGCWNAASNRAPVIGFNEILTRSAKDSMLRWAKSDKYSQYGIRQCPNPIFWKKRRWRKVYGHVHKIHSAGTGYRARHWPGFNGPRFINEVVLQRRGKKRQIAVLNTHWVPRGPKVPARWRKEMRKESKRLLRELTRKHLNEGRDVYVIGDLNLPGKIKMPDLFKWLVYKFVDKAGIGVPAGRRLLSARGTTFPAPTDHKHGGVLGIVRTKKRKKR